MSTRLNVPDLTSSLRQADAAVPTPRQPMGRGMRTGLGIGEMVAPMAATYGAGLYLSGDHDTATGAALTTGVGSLVGRGVGRAARLVPSQAYRDPLTFRAPDTGAGLYRNGTPSTQDAAAALRGYMPPEGGQFTYNLGPRSFRTGMQVDPSIRTEYDALNARNTEIGAELQGLRDQLPTARGDDLRDSIYGQLDRVAGDRPLDTMQTTHNDWQRAVDPATGDLSPGRMAGMDPAIQRRVRAYHSALEGNGIDRVALAGRTDIDYAANPRPQPGDPEQLQRIQADIARLEAEGQPIPSQLRALEARAREAYDAQLARQPDQPEAVQRAADDLDAALRADADAVQTRSNVDRAARIAGPLAGAGIAAGAGYFDPETLEATGQLAQQGAYDATVQPVKDLLASQDPGAPGLSADSLRTMAGVVGAVGATSVLGYLAYRLLKKKESEKGDEKPRRGRPPGSGRGRGRPRKTVAA